MPEPSIFISYRRDNGADLARIFQQFLEGQGYQVFLDVDDLMGGHFDEQILKRIESVSHVLVVCSQNALDRCVEPGDWLSREIAHAIKLKRVIVPVTTEAFLWPKPETLPADIRGFERYNAFAYSHKHWKDTKPKFAALFKTVEDSAQWNRERFIQVFLAPIVKLYSKSDAGQTDVQSFSELLNEAADSFIEGASHADRRSALAEIVKTGSKFNADVALAIADKSPEVQAAAKLYFKQVPGTLQQSMRRTEDRTGHTVPSDLPLSSAEDLLRLIPATMPMFRSGDCPVSHTDLELTEFLGKGGYGEVWRAKHLDRSNQPEVVLKFCIDERAARSLKKEVEFLDKIRSRGEHPGIVKLLNTHLRVTPPCLEYEYVGGGDLAKWFDERIRRATQPSPPQIAEIIGKIAEAVAFAHGLGIIHRDIKPQNVLVEKTADNKTRFKLTDFGIGGIMRTEALKDLRGAEANSAGTLSRGTCTPLYASAQQQSGGKPDPRDDVYALGVMWYQLLVGDLMSKAPQGSVWKAKLRSRGVADAMIELLEHCMEGDQEDRIADAGVLADKLKKLTVNVIPTISATLPPPPPPLAQLGWAKVLEQDADPSIVTNSKLAQRIKATGLPWRVTCNKTGIEMLLVPPGEFIMGESGGDTEVEEDGLPDHRVRLTKPFYLGRYPVTQAQWTAQIGSNPSQFQGAPYTDCPSRPVESVSWDDCQRFCAATGLRLPTEAEWEYACRAGDRKPRYGEPAEIGWFKENSANTTHPVGKKLPNALGLHDTLGNVWEWCQDWYGPYSSSAATNPAGPSSGPNRVLRGGSWGNGSSSCRGSRRLSATPDDAYNCIGFRSARTP